jgi:hypothetical protein
MRTKLSARTLFIDTTPERPTFYTDTTGCRRQTACNFSSNMMRICQFVREGEQTPQLADLFIRQLGLLDIRPEWPAGM